MKTMLFAAAVAALILPAVAAGAQTRTLTVSVAGRDLATPEGAREVFRDVTRAAAAVCENSAPPSDLSAWVDYRDCTRAAVRDAVAKLHAPLLTTLAEGEPRPVRIAGR